MAELSMVSDMTEQGFHAVVDLPASDRDARVESAVRAVEQDSDLRLLASALRDAEEARELGVIIGAAVDEMALRRARQRAARRDTLRMLGAVRGVTGGDAA